MANLITKSTRFILDKNLNPETLKIRLRDMFDRPLTKSERVETWGLKGGLCQQWVRLTMLFLGIKMTKDSNLGHFLHAWELFAALPDVNMKYFERNELIAKGLTDGIDKPKEFFYSNDDLDRFGVKNGSLVFGFYKNSEFFNQSITTIKNFSTLQGNDKIYKLKENIFSIPSSKSLEFNPITHVGIYYNKHFFNLISTGVSMHPTQSFQPIAYWDFLTPLNVKIKNRPRIPESEHKVGYNLFITP